MSCVNIRGCRIGEGRPKVSLPRVELTEAAFLEKADARLTAALPVRDIRVFLQSPRDRFSATSG